MFVKLISVIHLARPAWPAMSNGFTAATTPVKMTRNYILCNWALFYFNKTTMFTDEIP